MIDKDKLEQGKLIEQEHKDLYDRLKKQLQSQGVEMPISEDEFYETIAKAHLKEDKDYYELLIKYIEKSNERWNTLTDKDKNNIIEQTDISSQWFGINWSELPEDVKQSFIAYNITKSAMAKKNKLKSSIEPEKPKDKSKLKQTADKKSIAEMVAEEEQAKKDSAQLDVEGAFVENRDQFIALNKKAYGSLAIAEIKDFGHKQPFGHLRAIDDTHVFYLSEKLVSLLDKHNIHYTELESKDELIEYIEKL